MAWRGTITNVGSALLASRGESDTLRISSAAAGAGRVDDMVVMSQTELRDRKQPMSIVGQSRDGAGIKLRLQLTAPDEGYKMGQFGVFARLNGGDEVLLALFQNSAEVDIPSKTDSPDFSATFWALLTFSNMGQIDVTVDANALVTRKGMEEYVGGVAEGKADLVEGKIPTAQLPDGIVVATDDELPPVVVGLDADTLAGHMPDYFAKASDLTELETAIDEKLSRHSNRNLLDNWYYAGGGSQKGGGRFPINQRGQTEYTQNGYCIDRWAIGSTLNGTVSLDENGLRLETKGNIGYLFQEIEASRTQVGKTLTFSVLLADGKLLSASGIFPDAKDTDTIFASKDDESVAIVIVRLKTSLNGYLHPQIQFRNNGATIVAAKLEEGPVQTLAHREGDAWVLNETPDYGEELAKCQRYYWVSDRIFPTLGYFGSDYAICEVPFPVEMRIKPAVTILPVAKTPINAVSEWSTAVTRVTDVYANPASLSKQGLGALQARGDTKFDTNNRYSFYVVADANL